MGSLPELALCIGSAYIVHPDRCSVQGWSAITPQTAEADLQPGSFSTFDRFAARFQGRAGQLFAAILILGAFTLAVLYPLVIGRRLYWGDITLYFDVSYGLVRRALLQGRLPLWNPSILGGQPFVGNPQCSLFYPSSILLRFMSVGCYESVNTISNIFLSGLCMWVYLRRWTIRNAPAIVGGLVYMGSSALLGRIQFPPMVQTAPYFPLVMLMVDRSIDRPSGRNAAKGALVVGLCLLAGHPQMAYLIFACATIYAVMRLEARRRRHIQRNAPPESSVHSGMVEVYPGIICLLTALAVGAALAGVQLLPTLQLFITSPREHLTAMQANRFVLSPGGLLTLLIPGFFGHPAHGNYWGGGNAWEPALFVGWMPLFFVAYAVVRCRREGLIRFWSVGAAAGVWLGLGSLGGLFWVAFHVVPGISNFHDPARFLIISTFAAAVLSAAGFDALQANRPRYRTYAAKAVLVLLTAVPLWWYGREWNPTARPETLRPSPTGVAIETHSGASTGLSSGRIYMPEHDIFGRRYISDGYADYGPSRPRMMKAFVDTQTPNLGVSENETLASGYEPVPVLAYANMDGMIRTALKRGEPNTTRLAGLLNITVFCEPASAPIRLPGLIPLPTNYHEQTRLRINRDAFGRVWMVRSTRRVEGNMRIIAALAAPNFAPGRCAVVSNGSEAMPEDLQTSDLSELCRPVTITEQTAESLTANVSSGNARAFCIASMTAYPGWFARIDGAPADLYRTNGALLGTYVPPGTHRVQFYYNPSANRAGAYLSLLAAMSIVAVWTGSLAIRRSYRESSDTALPGEAATMGDAPTDGDDDNF